MSKNNKKSSRLNTFILSLVFAVAIWVIVSIVNDPDIKNTITSPEIKYSGISNLTNHDLVIVSAEDKNTSYITVSGKRADLIRSGKNVYISVDVSEITSPGVYSLSGSAQAPGNRISIIRDQISDVEVTVEKIAEKEIPIEIKQTGSIKNSLVKTESDSDKIKVRGAQSEIEKVGAAVVTTDISKITHNDSYYLPFDLVDESGEKLTKATTLTTITDRIPVFYTVYEKKTLPIKPQLSSELENEYYLNTDECTIFPAIVEVGVTDKCKSECVYALIDDANSDNTEYDLIAVDGMYIPKEKSTVKIKAGISKLKSEHTDMSVKIENLGEGLNAIFTDTVTDVLVSSSEDILNNDDFYLIADLKDLEKGSHRVKAKISDERIRLNEEIYIDIVIE